MSSDSEIALAFKFKKEIDKERKEKNIKASLEVLKNHGINCNMDFNNASVKLKSSVGTVMFYPSTGRWQHKNKTYSGGAKSFIGWLKNQNITIKD